MRAIIGFLRDPLLHLIALVAIVCWLCLGEGPDPDRMAATSCPSEVCPICKLYKDKGPAIDGVEACEAHGIELTSD